MELIQAMVLGLVQGATEFLPVSSSGHLVLIPYLLGWPLHSQAFDVALHLGTALAMLGFFRNDWLRLAHGLLQGLGSSSARASDPTWRQALFVVVGCVPIGLSGLLFEDAIERLFRNPLPIAIAMILFALLLLAADRLLLHHRPLEELRWPDAIIVGLAQSLALIPGVSRSGITVTTGLFLGLTRVAAVRFSFLLSGPPIIAAGLWKLRHGVPDTDLLPFMVGTITSALVGWLAIGMLLRYVQQRSLMIFVLERIIVGGVTLSLILWQGFKSS